MFRSRSPLRLRELLIVLLALLLPLRAAVATALAPCPFAGLHARIAAAPDPGRPQASGGAMAAASSMHGDGCAGSEASARPAHTAAAGTGGHAAGRGAGPGHGKPGNPCPSCGSCAASCSACTAAAVAASFSAVAQPDLQAASPGTFAVSADPYASYIGSGLDRPPRPL